MSEANLQSPTGRAWQRFKSNRAGWCSAWFLAGFVLLAALWPALAPYPPDAISDAQFRPPSAAHWFGTDVHGRDLLTRVLYGARISLLVGGVGAGVSLVIGVLWGAVAGYVGGRLDGLMMRIVDVLYALPSIVFVIVLLTALNGILDRSIAPSPEGALTDAAPRAQAIAAIIAGRMDYVGTLGVEFFLSRGELLVNEIAPRPHNSGHYTLDACVTNQFEQQVRTLCGLPLGDTDAHCAAVCVNLLGELWYPDGASVPREPDWRRLLERPGLRLHLYGKDQPRPGRKMGHFTVIGRDRHEVLLSAMAARAAIGIRDDRS